MSLFRRKQKGYLGIDFGAGGIKVIQLKPAGGRGGLFTYGFSEQSVEETGVEYLDQPDKAGELLKAICTKAKTTTVNAVAALPIPAVFSAVLSIGAVPKKEILQAVQWEAKKLIPLPLEDVVLDYKELSTTPSPMPIGRQASLNKEGKKGEEEKEEKKEKSMQILLTAAPKGIIDKYVAIAKQAGLTLVSLETEAFALIRSLIGSDPTPSVIVDIGAVRSNILIIDQGIPMLTRSIEVGGKNCTQAIAKSLGMDAIQAESMKRDLGSGTLSRESSQSVLPMLQEILQPLVNELKYSLNVYRTRNNNARPVERIIISGGGSGIPGLVEFFTQEFNLRSFVGNPWEKVNFHPDLNPLLQTFGSRFAVAIGLALRNL